MVDENIGEIVAQNPESPCMIKLINSQREVNDKPNIWSTMNTVKIQVKVEEIPKNGEVRLISSFDPSFWMNQPKTIYEIVETEGTEMQFKSTNEVWVITRCKGGRCIKSDNAKGSQAAFRLKYTRITEVVDEEETVDWSLYITICFGFSLMLIALMYFEWRTIFKCI